MRHIVIFKQGTQLERVSKAMQLPPSQMPNAVERYRSDKPLEDKEAQHFPNLGMVAANLDKKAVAELQANPDVLAVEPDVKMYAIGGESQQGYDVPSFLAGASEMYARLTKAGADLLADWASGKAVIPGSLLVDWPLLNLGTTKAWEKGYTGTGVKVAVLDTGCTTGHVDLSVKGGVNFIPGEQADNWNDGNGHGSHVTGRIAAKPNSAGVTGVAHGSEIWITKVLSDKGEGYTSSILAALEWCATNGIKVANLSLGAANVPQQSYAAAVKRCLDAGCVVVAASGNQGHTKWPYVMSPANTPGVVAVGAVTQKNALLAFSSRGKQPGFSGEWNGVTCVAPGSDINSTVPGNKYAIMSGTSMAAPFVTGICALIWQANPGKTAQEIVEILKRVCADSGAVGYDDATGYGIPSGEKI